jgi:hypothetical protein
MSDNFEEWYSENFSDIPGSNNEEYKLVTRTLWSLIVERIARNVEISVFEDISGEAVAAMIRAMK